MSKEFTVRLATLDDVPAMARHRAAMFRDMGEVAEDLVEALVDVSRQYLTAAVASGEYVGWIASPAAGSEVIAGAGLQLRRVLPRPAASGRELVLGLQGLVLNVYTDPAWRRRGVAELLMSHVIEWARANRLASLVLHASADGRALYERLGFVPTNEMRYTGDLAAQGRAVDRHASNEYPLSPIGYIRSTLRALAQAPRQGSEGAPDAWLEVDAAYARGLSRLAAGDDVIVVTWLHRADRTVLEVHPRDDLRIPLTGVFATRSPDRPNPLGLHRVKVHEIDGTRLRIGPIEAIDGTPVVDVKAVLASTMDA